jgi:hypothetical protein
MIKCFFILDDESETISQHNLDLIEPFKENIFVFVDSQYTQANQFIFEYPLIVIYKNKNKKAIILLAEDIGLILLNLFRKKISFQQVKQQFSPDSSVKSAN